MKSFNILFILISFLLLSCEAKTDQSQSKKSIAPKKESPQSPAVKMNDSTDVEISYDYHLNKPDITMMLASKLVEISGLSFDQKANQLLAINDEKGRLYQLDPETGDIIEDTKFGKKGDYEGVEIVDQSIFILESSGQLNLMQKNSDEKATKIRTTLRQVNDLEGLGYDKKTKSLLLACKGSSNISAKQKLKKTKAVYSLTLADTSFSEDPVFTIEDVALEAFINSQEEYSQISESKKKKYLKRIKSFSPSAIAQHPEEDSFYILSSQGKTLVVIDRTSKILSATFLNDSVHRQPEGICFDGNSNMYVSNEGKLGLAKIHKYIPKVN